jgi:hypothetical protein
MPNRSAFLSHKVKDAKLAKQVQRALGSVFPAVKIFLSEEITKARDFRSEISRALTEASFFILLYTDPSEDWSWCFYEVGSYRSLKPRPSDAKERPFYCLHSGDFQAPSPVANLQTVKASLGDIERWIRDLSVLLKHKTPPAAKIASAARKIELAIKAPTVFHEQVLKPYIWITPPWPGGRTPDWHAARLPPILLENSRIAIDQESSTKLGFSEPPDRYKLLEFLKMMDGDSVGDKKSYWIERFFHSLTKALHGNLNLQEVAYFRHQAGGVYRPVVVGVAKSRNGANCKLKVFFAHAHGAPLTNQPSIIQRLADGVRLGVRTRIEVIEEYSGNLSRIYRQKVMSASAADEVARNYLVGSRVKEALEAITEEARAHGLREDQPAPKLFSERNKQAEYQRIREKSISIRNKLRVVADREDAADTGKYAETEKLLLELKEMNKKYLALAVPRLDVLLRAPG